MSMDSQTLNAHISEWKRATILYQIAIFISLTIFTIIVILWVVIEIINVKRRKQISLECQKHQMDGVKIMQRLNEINNNQNKAKINTKPHNKPLLQTVVINNMNKNYKLSQIKRNNNDEEQMTRLTQDIEMTDKICEE